MSYYILPKNINKIELSPKDDVNECKLYISHSLFNYYNKIMNEINNSINNSLNKYKDILTIVNPYEFIYSKVPGSQYSVSKLKEKTCLFYDLLEIIVNLDIFENFNNEPINCLDITEYHSDLTDCFQMLREDSNDNIINFNQINDSNIKLIENIKFNFLFFETKNNTLNEYIISLMEILMVILKNQLINGNCIIKINTIFYKPIVDILYFLSSLFEKVYIFKPNTSNVTTFEKYIICKSFKSNENKLKSYKINYYRLLVFLKKMENKNIVSILNSDIPYFFYTKVNDINNIISQQQFEHLDLIINIFKNKNKDGKIEIIQKSNIQKSVLWCEKYKIPCNKFFEKTNIFLPIIKKNINELLANE